MRQPIETICFRRSRAFAALLLRGQEGRGVHAFEVTHDPRKQVVWKCADHDLVKSITMVRVLDNK
jgi:hypothetical protein